MHRYRRRWRPSWEWLVLFLAGAVFAELSECATAPVGYMTREPGDTADVGTPADPAPDEPPTFTASVACGVCHAGPGASLASAPAAEADSGTDTDP